MKIGNFPSSWPEPDPAPAILRPSAIRCVCGCPAAFHLPDLDGLGALPGETPARGPCSGCGCHRFRP